MVNRGNRVSHRVSGTWTQLDTTNSQIADNSVVTLTCDGSSITFEDDGVEILGATDTSITSAGYGGIGMGAVIVSGNDVSIQEMDDFTMTTLSGSGGVGPEANTTYYPFSNYEVTDTGTTTKHIYAGDQLIATIEGSGAGALTYYNHLDHLNSTRATTNGIGATQTLTDYFPFGDTRIDIDYGDFRQHIQHTGHHKDDETALIYMGARYYAGDTGRFTSQDPVSLALGDWKTVQDKTGGQIEFYLRNPQTHNSYSYTANNPLKYVDKNGEFLWFAAPLVIYAPEIIAAGVTLTSSAFLTSMLADDLATLSDPNASFGEKALIVGLSVFRGGGKAGSALVKEGDKLVPVFRGGSGKQLFNIRPGEIKVDADGFVKNTRGVSVDSSASNVSKFGGANQIEYLPDTLQINQVGKNASHYEIVPTGKLTPDEFQSELGKIKTRRIEE